MVSTVHIHDRHAALSDRVSEGIYDDRNHDGYYLVCTTDEHHFFHLLVFKTMMEYYSVQTKYSEQGWRYYSDKEVESDGHNAKIWHYIVRPNGEVLDMDFSPYQYPNAEQIEQFIEAYIDMESKMDDLY